MASPTALERVRKENLEEFSSTFTEQADQADAARKVVYLSTEEAYDRWAAVYDTDGNFLQAIDDRELAVRLPQFLDAALATHPANASKVPVIVDLGCGTGRNTFKLQQLRPTARVIGLDGSREMLKLAQKKRAATAHPDITGLRSLEFYYCDIHDIDGLDRLGPEDESTDQGTISLAGRTNAVISTLVVEHIALADFFAMAARLLVPGGLLLITNMSDEMGKISQAGFVDPASGEKVRPKSYAHSVSETVQEAAKWGFEVAGSDERGVAETDVADLGPRSRKWIGINCWWTITLRMREEGGST